MTKFVNLLTMLIFVTAIPLSDVVLAATSDRVLAARAVKLYNSNDGSSKGERYFQVSLILDAILATHPRSLTALRVKKNKLPDMNVEEVRRVAEEWEREFPEQAAQVRSDRVIVEPGQSKFEPPTTVVKDPALQSPTFSNDSVGGAVSLGAGRQPTTQAVLASPAPAAIGNLGTTSLTPKKFRRGQRTEILNGATVLVIGLVKKDGRLQVGWHGSGFFINQNQVLTNAHVARDAHAFVIASQVLGIGQGTVAAFGQTKSGLGIDAAVINVKGIEPISPLVFSVDLLQGDTILMAGYPGVIRKSDQSLGKLFAFIDDHVKPPQKIVPSLRITDTGVIEAIFDRDGIDDLQYTMETTGGNSGSPVVNACVQIVGLHYSGISDDNNNSKYNFGHSAVSVREFLDSNAIEYSTAQSPCEQG